MNKVSHKVKNSFDYHTFEYDENNLKKITGEWYEPAFTKFANKSPYATGGGNTRVRHAGWFATCPICGEEIGIKSEIEFL